MRRSVLCLLLLFAATGIARSLPADAAPGAASATPLPQATGISPIALSLVRSCQIPSEGCNILGLRLGLFQGVHRSLAGLDVCLFSAETDGSLAGLQVAGFSTETRAPSLGIQAAGFFNRSASFTGIQIAGLANRTEGGFRGIQVAAIANFGENLRQMTGLQIALHNTAEMVEGMQLGLVNFATGVVGGQIGLYNRAEIVRGFQIGFANACSVLQGIQIGVGNHTDGTEIDWIPLFNLGF